MGQAAAAVGRRHTSALTVQYDFRGQATRQTFWPTPSLVSCRGGLREVLVKPLPDLGVEQSLETPIRCSHDR